MISTPELPIRVSSPFVRVIILPVLLLLTHELSGGGVGVVTCQVNDTEGSRSAVLFSSPKVELYAVQNLNYCRSVGLEQPENGELSKADIVVLWRASSRSCNLECYSIRCG